MLTRASSLAVLLMVATGAGAAAQGFVVDGGDEEAGSRALATSPSPRLDEDPGRRRWQAPGAHGPDAPTEGLRVQRRLPDAPEDPQVRELRHAAALRRPVRRRPEALRRDGLGQHALRARRAGGDDRRPLRRQHRDGRLELVGGTEGPEPPHEANHPRRADARGRCRLRRDGHDGSRQRTRRRARAAAAAPAPPPTARSRSPRWASPPWPT